MQYINVVIDNKSELTDTYFTYRAPDSVAVGDKVSALFSNRKKPATVGGSTIGKVSIPSIIAFFPGVVFTTLRAA